MKNKQDRTKFGISKQTIWTSLLELDRN